jgi:hypothetical protein
MLLIAHRANLNGKSETENSPTSIDYAIKNNYHVEIDLRTENNKLYLGHDFCQYEIDIKWLLNRNDFLWIHAKDEHALEICLNEKLHCFWHQQDTYTLTSKGFIWGYPGSNQIKKLMILNQPEISDGVNNINKIKNINNYFGICSDYVELIKNNIF